MPRWQSMLAVSPPSLALMVWLKTVRLLANPKVTGNAACTNTEARNKHVQGPVMRNRLKTILLKADS